MIVDGPSFHDHEPSWNNVAREMGFKSEDGVGVDLKMKSEALSNEAGPLSCAFVQVCVRYYRTILELWGSFQNPTAQIATGCVCRARP